MAESLKQILEKAGKTLSSDAHSISKISAANVKEAFQPAKLWYGDSNQPQEHVESDGQSYATDSIDADEAAGPPPIGLYMYTPSTPHIPDGLGTTVAILDSGINTAHTAFVGKISLASKSFVGGGIEDTLGHGTQCAGLACGLQDTVSFSGGIEHIFKGIATGAQLLVCKVVRDGQTEADIDAVCQALDYIMEQNTYRNTSLYDPSRVTVASLSLGMPHFNVVLSKKVQEAISHDIIIVCAASNDGRQITQPITYPARLGNTLCIGSCNDHGKPSSFSPTGREMDFLAFGENVCAPTVGGSHAYDCVSGTSFSAPQVAGLICQIVQDLKQLLSESSSESYLEHLHNVWAVREILKRMAVIKGRHDEELGYGSLNPKDYFRKTTHEKGEILSNILTNS